MGDYKLKQIILLSLLIAILTACQKQSVKKHVLMAEKLTITPEFPISFRNDDHNGYLEVLADTTGDRLPDIKILVSTQPLEEHICFLRIAYPKRDLTFYNGIVILDSISNEWTFKPFGGTGDANVMLK